MSAERLSIPSFFWFLLGSRLIDGLETFLFILPNHIEANPFVSHYGLPFFLFANFTLLGLFIGTEYTFQYLHRPDWLNVSRLIWLFVTIFEIAIPIYNFAIITQL